MVYRRTDGGITRVLIGGRGGGGCEYSYIRVLPDEFLLKSAVFKFISKEITLYDLSYHTCCLVLNGCVTNSGITPRD